MQNLIKHKSFISTFLLVYFLFFIVTITVLNIKQGGFAIGSIAYGFPFTYYFSHCFGGYYIYSGIIGNMFVAAFIGTILGLINSYLFQNTFPRIYSKISSAEFQSKASAFKSKWYL